MCSDLQHSKLIHVVTRRPVVINRLLWTTHQLAHNSVVNEDIGIKVRGSKRLLAMARIEEDQDLLACCIDIEWGSISIPIPSSEYQYGSQERRVAKEYLSFAQYPEHHIVDYLVQHTSGSNATLALQG